MRVVLVGADFEENLGMGMIAAAAQQARHDVTVMPYNHSSECARLAECIAGAAPDVLGISAQFQHRAADFLGLATALRARGFAGHITMGGQFPTLAFPQVLADDGAVDSVVLHDGEQTFVELLAALRDRTPLSAVPGLALRDERGVPVRTPPRALAAALDDLPFAARYRPHARHVGVPFVPIMGSRGCWGSCAYCSITSFYRDARAHGGGHTLRHRSPENIAAEMALLQDAAGTPCIFCFHDDNFLLPKPEASLARVRAIRAALDAFGVGRAGMIGKCRPDSMSPDLARELRALGVLRLYVGVENASPDGADHLNRRTQATAVRGALKACREAGIFVCYNLLLFEPRATLEHVRENVAFIREHAAHPVNFCRAEPYVGTPLQLDLAARDALYGSFLGWNYRLEDPRAELLFRVCAAAFRQRNFDPDGVANRYMGLGYAGKLLEYFYEDPEGRRPALLRRVADLTRAISLDTAEHLESAIQLVERADLADGESIERKTALLGLRVAAADAVWHAELDQLYSDLDAFAARARQTSGVLRVPRELLRAAQRVALGASLAASAAVGCKSNREQPTMQPNTQGPGDLSNGGARSVPTVVDMVPYPPPVDPPPPPMSYDAGPVVMPPDPVPPPRPVVVDPVPYPMPPDPPPPPPRVRDAGVRYPRVPPVMPPDPVPPPRRPHVVDPAPRHLPMDPVPKPSASGAAAPSSGDDGKDAASAGPRRLALIDQWRSTTASEVPRTDDLPLARPPEVALRYARDGERYRVWIEGAPTAVGTRWQSAGAIEGDGAEVRWTPSSPTDQLRVAVRARGGVAVAALRAVELR